MSETTTGHVRIIAVIPAFNEGASICSLIRETQRHVDEVIVVDDGSTDHTANLAEGAGATVIRHDHNRGKAGAIMTGLRAAAERDAEALVLLDGDGQHNPADIPSLLQPILLGAADVVVGSRFLEVHSPIPFYRTIGQRVLNVATWLGSGVRCSDSQCGYRALNRRAYTAIHLRETYLHGLAAESEMQFELAAKQLRLAEVPIYVHYDGKARRSPIKHGGSVLYRVLVMTARRQQQRLAGVEPASIPLGSGARKYSVPD